MATPNPYVGPRVFEEKDAGLFFGRDTDAEGLLALVLSRRLVLFYSPSGAGKSSLIRTRLIPGLRDEGFRVLPVCRVGGGPAHTGQASGNVFITNLMASLPPTGNASPAQPPSLSEYLSGLHTTDAADEPVPIVLIIDQFEEIVTSHLDRYQDREGFFTQLRDAIRDDPLLWVVLVMREDYAPELDRYTSLLPGRLQARFQMQRMNTAAAKEAIAEPARIGNRPFAEDAVTALVDNLRQIQTAEEKTAPGEFIEPVQLQVVCYQLWQNLADRPPGEITLDDLRDLGDVDAALSQYYERTLAIVIAETGGSEAELRNWFETRLITPQRTRATVFRGSEATAELPNAIIDHLAERYMLRAEVWAGGTWYELIHDRFITPILNANRNWQARQGPLVQAAFDWDRAGRPKENLYGGDVLQLALSTTDRLQAGSIVDDFLTASEDRDHERQLAARVEAERQRAEEQAGEARRFRALAIFALALGVIAFIAAIGAIQGQRNSNKARATSDAARATSDVALTAAVAALDAQAQLVGQLLTATVGAPSTDDLPMGGESATATPQILATPPPPALTQVVGGSETTEEPDVAVEATPTPAFLALISPTTPAAEAVDSLQDQLNNIRATQAAITGIVGQSVRGQPIEVYRFGSGPSITLLLGGLNGGFAPASTELAQRAIDYFSANPDAIPAGSAVHIIPNTNPDSPRVPGEIEGRLNANGVDLNRNFDCSWTSDVQFRDQPISAGSSAFSEPETQALRDYINSVQPASVIIYGARATNGWVVPGFCANRDSGSTALAASYARASGYEQRSVAVSGSGESIDWIVTRGVPAVYVLLRSYDALSEADWTANLEAILATFSSTARN